MAPIIPITKLDFSKLNNKILKKDNSNNYTRRPVSDQYSVKKMLKTYIIF